MPDSVAAIEFLAREKTPAVPAVCVLSGDEPLLKSESLARLRAEVLSGEDGELSVTVFDGDDAEPREIFDELATMSMFGSGRRLVVVENAADFISKHRQALQDYCEKPRSNSVLVIEVDSWPSNTKLFKKVAEIGLAINCNLPKNRFGDVDEGAALKWLTARAERQHHVRLASDAGEMLLEIVGPQLGRLDQELAKLALLAGREPELATRKPDAGIGTTATISRELVEKSVGGWRAKTVWVMIEVALDGKAAAALVELDRLLLAGEEPIGILAMMSGSLRRMAAAARIVEISEAQRRRISLSDALREAGVTPKPFVLEKTARQLRQITRQRAKKILGWLLDADLALKSTSSSGTRARLVLEKLIVKLSAQMAPKVPVR